MERELTKEEEEMLRAILHDARTLEPADMEREFRSYREQIDKERCGHGEEPFSAEDWDHLHSFYTIFFREGFCYGVIRMTEAVNSATDYLTGLLTTTPDR